MHSLNWTIHMLGEWHARSKLILFLVYYRNGNADVNLFRRNDSNICFSFLPHWHGIGTAYNMQYIMKSMIIIITHRYWLGSRNVYFLQIIYCHFSQLFTQSALQCTHLYHYPIRIKWPSTFASGLRSELLNKKLISTKWSNFDLFYSF